MDRPLDWIFLFQLRIDFQNFVITGPNTVVGVTTVSIVGGSIGTGGKAASDRVPISKYF
jgi:hypothetical protein